MGTAISLIEFLPDRSGIVILSPIDPGQIDLINRRRLLSQSHR